MLLRLKRGKKRLTSVGENVKDYSSGEGTANRWHSSRTTKIIGKREILEKNSHIVKSRLSEQLSEKKEEKDTRSYRASDEGASEESEAAVYTKNFF